MGDVPLIAGSLIGAGVVYCIILIFVTLRTENTERPDLEAKGGQRK